MDELKSFSIHNIRYVMYIRYVFVILFFKSKKRVFESKKNGYYFFSKARFNLEIYYVLEF